MFLNFDFIKLIKYKNIKKLNLNSSRLLFRFNFNFSTKQDLFLFFFLLKYILYFEKIYFNKNFIYFDISNFFKYYDIFNYFLIKKLLKNNNKIINNFYILNNFDIFKNFKNNYCNLYYNLVIKKYNLNILLLFF
jgi:hypothetical protein